MVSALFQSRPSERGGTRKFTISGCSFGWSVIEDLYTREVERIKAGQCSRVPKLKESYVQRDSWTRLNVLPSKVMQVSTCISVCACACTCMSSFTYIICDPCLHYYLYSAR